MKNETVIYVLRSRADADACAFRLKESRPPYVVEPVIETKEVYAASFAAIAYAPGTAPTWSHVEYGQPTVFVVVASR